MNPQVEIVPSDAATEQTSLEQHGFTRRQFIAGSAATLAIAAAGGVSALEFPANAEALTEAEPLGGEWIRTTCSPNCTGACGINAWVQDGQVRLLKQAADYPYGHYNPRGCLKGLSINTILHGPDRLTKPLMKNEDGEQIETDWDTALDTAADKLREIAEKYGPDSIGVIYQVQGTGHIQKGALVRIANTFGWSIIGGYELNGDLPMFWPETFGCQSEELESYCWEDSKLTLVFGSNVMVTRMPDAHFLTYSQENGGKVIYFDPNYSASAEKANEWVRIAPDSDGAFALAMAKTIIDEDLYDKHFMQTYTDSPFLINLETGKKILAEEVQGLSPTPGLPDFRKSYVAVDQTSGALQATNPLKLDDNNYALMGSYDVPLKDGTTAKAKTGFQLLTEQLENYTPEAAADICKIDADTGASWRSIPRHHAHCTRSSHGQTDAHHLRRWNAAVVPRRSERSRMCARGMPHRKRRAARRRYLNLRWSIQDALQHGKLDGARRRGQEFVPVPLLGEWPHTADDGKISQARVQSARGRLGQSARAAQRGELASPCVRER